MLSSASCVYQSDSNQLSVWAGSNSLISLFGRRYEIQSKTIFPSFDASSGKDDIALLKTVLAFGFDGRVQPIALPTAQPGNGVRGMISGWGSLKKYPEYPINLNELSTVTISNAQCRSLTGKNISLDRLCTSAGAGKGACSVSSHLSWSIVDASMTKQNSFFLLQGDSGGPLTVNNQLAGIASWSTPCAVGVADVYTCVYSYVSWIAANTIWPWWIFAYFCQKY